MEIPEFGIDLGTLQSWETEQANKPAFAKESEFECGVPSPMNESAVELGAVAYF